MTAAASDLKRFQTQADADALVAYLRSKGHEASDATETLRALTPVLSSLRFGEEPNYESLDREKLLEHRVPVEDTIRAMLGSDVTDLRNAAYQLMGFMDFEVFLPDLSAALESERTWVRVAAIQSLARMSLQNAREQLEQAAQHPDKVTRNAARNALAVSAGP